MEIFDLILVRSKPSSDAVARLISDPLIQGLRERGLQATIISPDIYRNKSHNSNCVIFHYDDNLALEAIRNGEKPNIVACLGSDIYSFEIYIRSHDLVDVYFAPTEEHCSILKSQLVKPVFLLPESVDLTSLYVGDRQRLGKSVCWFGYPESFGKAMTSLMPVIERCLQEHLIDRFALITDANSTLVNDQLELVPYSVETFGQDIGHFDYAILSHFALDLHINSIIKSPNKLITAICSGLIPLASSTPAYSSILRRHDLSQFLFDSPMTLFNILCNLDPDKDLQKINNSDIRNSLMQEYSPSRTSDAFMIGLSKLGELANNRWMTDITPKQWLAKIVSDKQPRKGIIRAFKDRTFGK